MNAKIFSDAMGVIDGSYIEEAVIYQGVRNPMPPAELAVAAACLLLAFAIIIPIINRQNHNTIIEIESKFEMTLSEAMNDKTFGGLFPKQILTGYVPEEKPGIYDKGDNAVLKAASFNC